MLVRKGRTVHELYRERYVRPLREELIHGQRQMQRKAQRGPREGGGHDAGDARAGDGLVSFHFILHEFVLLSKVGQREQDSFAANTTT